MSKLDKHISELLYDHECVIVPELGGFLTSYAPARMNPGRHTITAPSKKIAFNVFLKQNDGLLANYIVQAESLSYPDALREIESYVSLCNTELVAGKKFVIEQVGILTRDAEANVQFEPFKNVNYLKDSFGLSPVQLMPVTNNDFEQKVEKQLRDFISLRPSQAQVRQPLPQRRFKLNALNTMLLGGSILWFCLNLYIVSPDKLNLASLNPFSVPENEPAKIETPVIYTQPSAAHPETVYVKTTTPVELPAPEVKTIDSMHQYYIVAGAFRSQGNAEKMVEEMKANGYEHSQVIDNGDGFQLVCLDKFDSQAKAVDALSSIKSSHNDAWIFRR